MQFKPTLGSSVGVAVRDLDPVLDLYTEGLGLGPFKTEEIEISHTTYHVGHETSSGSARLRIATAPLGPCEMELIEVTSGRPPHADFIDAEGEGMNHFNLDKGSAEGYLDTLSKLYWRGIEPFWGLPFGSFCYVESETIGGVTFEVMVGSGHAGKIGHNHLGLVVEDTQKTIDFYTEHFGLGAFRTGEFPMGRGFYRDQRIETSFRASFCDLGPSELRLYQVLEGETPFCDQLNAKGEGMHHLCLTVDDLEEALAGLAAAGIETIWKCPALRLAMLDSRQVGGMTFALTEAT
jgi:methylmalonyl-CoA/ethylmalonyl-CoA epimerase